MKKKQRVGKKKDRDISITKEKAQGKHMAEQKLSVLLIEFRYRSIHQR